MASAALSSALSAALPPIDLQPYLSDPSSPAALAACATLADTLVATSALVVRDPRVPAGLNDRFIDLLERYYAQPRAATAADERPEVHFQVGVTPEGTEVPLCGAAGPRPAWCAAKLASLPPASQPAPVSGADAKWRFFWRLEEQEEAAEEGRDATGDVARRADGGSTSGGGDDAGESGGGEFGALHAPQVVPAAFAAEWAPTMDAWGHALLRTVRRSPQRPFRPGLCLCSPPAGLRMRLRLRAAPLIPEGTRRPFPPRRARLSAHLPSLRIARILPFAGAHRRGDGGRRPRARADRAHIFNVGRPAPSRAHGLRLAPARGGGLGARGLAPRPEPAHAARQVALPGPRDLAARREQGERRARRSRLRRQRRLRLRLWLRLRRLSRCALALGADGKAGNPRSASIPRTRSGQPPRQLTRRAPAVSSSPAGKRARSSRRPSPPATSCCRRATSSSG